MDGRLLDVVLTASPIRGGAGTIIGASIIVRDVTQHNLAERALRDSEARFRELADSMPQIVWRADGAGRVDYFNGRWHELTGMSATPDAPGALPGRHDVVHPDDLADVAARWERSVREGVTHGVEIRLRDAKNGGYRWHLARAVPVRDGYGVVARWYGTNTDIDDLKRAEHGRRESAAQLKAIMDAAADSILTLDDLGYVRSANRAVERAFGYGEQEIVGRCVDLLLANGRAALAGGAGDVLEADGRRRDGTTFPAELSANTWQQGGRHFLTVVVRDVTTRKRVAAQAKMQQAELAHMERVRTMGQMAAGLAQELNQPLGAM